MHRHTLLYVKASAWAEITAASGCRNPLVRRWATHWPVAFDRVEENEHRAFISSLQLPFTAGSGQVVVSLGTSDIANFRSPLDLSQIRPTAPPDWLDTIDTLIDVAVALQAEVRVFGAFSWAALTGLDYLSSCSTLDLAIVRTTDLLQLYRFIVDIARAAPGKIRVECMPVRPDAEGGLTVGSSENSRN